MVYDSIPALDCFVGQLMKHGAKLHCCHKSALPAPFPAAGPGAGRGIVGQQMCSKRGKDGVLAALGKSQAAQLLLHLLHQFCHFQGADLLIAC